MAELLAVIVDMAITLPNFQFKDTCHMDTTVYFACVIMPLPLRPRTVIIDAYSSAATVIIHGIILLLTLVKQACAIRAGCSRIPVIMLMIRDGAILFLIVLGEWHLQVLTAKCISNAAIPPKQPLGF